jgi:hypothetical protein
VTLSREQLLVAALEDALSEWEAWVEEHLIAGGERYRREKEKIERLRRIAEDK